MAYGGSAKGMPWKLVTEPSTTPITWALSSVAVASVEGADEETDEDADAETETEDAGMGTVEKAGGVLVTSESVLVLADEAATAPRTRASWRKATSREEDISMVKWYTEPDKPKKRWRAEVGRVLGRWNGAITRSRAWFICARSPQRADTLNGSRCRCAKHSHYCSCSESLDAQ